MQRGNTKAKVAGSFSIDCNIVSILFNKESTAEWLHNMAKVDGLLLGHLTEQTAFQLIKLL